MLGSVAASLALLRLPIKVPNVLFISSFTFCFLASELLEDDRSSRSAIDSPGTPPLKRCANIVRTSDSVTSLLRFTFTLEPSLNVIRLSIDIWKSGLFTGSTNLLFFMLSKNCCNLCLSFAGPLPSIVLKKSLIALKNLFIKLLSLFVLLPILYLSPTNM